MTDGNFVASKHITDIQYSLIDGLTCLSKKYRKSQNIKRGLPFRKWPYKNQVLRHFPVTRQGHLIS